ncbi:hypothetical protein QBC45DRAFT_331542 [Copromyces sp. CBS 386.78]|nr:hypothetical protein QBC45DRAFT_331542 [Copromyces sp. CBS 386.78]
MSGLEGLAAFGLACNVMQAISFSIEMISVCRTVFHNGSPDPSMASLLTHSTDITTSLERSISSASSIGPDERKLLDIARECLDVIAKLKIEVGKCSSSSAKGKYLPSIGLALQAKWKESKVAKLESQMQKHQRVLDSGLLVHIWKKTDATQLGQDAGFQRLDSNLRKYIRDVSDRLRAAEDEAIQTRKTVTSTIISEAAKTHDMVTQTVTSTIISEAAKTHDMVTQMTLDQRKATLLKSRNYPTRGHPLQNIFQKVPSAEIKEFEGDWTGEELEKATLSTLELLATASTPIFIFLDGLDEIGASNPGMSDDPPGLLRLVEKLSAVDHVRLCVSSRPEFVFKKQLGAMPSLRLQDLTRPDMEKYAKDELLSNEVVGLKDQAEYRKLVNKLCDMSDGVFLWTALAVRSLSRGLTNEDDISELYARLEKMPKGLYALYKDMWERLNEDQDLYKKEAAQCFNLVMHWQRMPSHEFSKRCTKFHLLASLDPSISRACLNDDKPRFSSDLEAACKRIGKRVEIRSAGLLELGDQGSIDFIHRSALEFLMDTPEGQQIMAHDKSTPNELRSWLLQADVARAYLKLMKPFDPPIVKKRGVVHIIIYHIGDIDGLMRDVDRNWEESALPGDVQIMLLEACRRMAEAEWRAAMERGRHERHWVLIECDTAYAAELLTLGWAVREGSTSENTANTMTDRDEIWRRPAGLKKADPRILAFGEDSFFKRPAEYRTPANCEDANRVLSTLGNIRLDQSGIGFLIPELGNTLNEMIKSEDPLYHKEYLKLAKENSFNNFVEEFIRSFKKLTCSAEHLAWIAEEEKKRREWKDRLLLRTAQRKGITR